MHKAEYWYKLGEKSLIRDLSGEINFANFSNIIRQEGHFKIRDLETNFVMFIIPTGFRK